MKKIKSYNLDEQVIKDIHDRAVEDDRKDSDWLNVYLKRNLARNDLSIAKPRKKMPANSKVDINYAPTKMSQIEYLELLRIRKKNKGGAITQRVVNGLSIEFEKARKQGLTNDQILTEWEVRGWKSFKAEWVKSSNSNGQDFSDDKTGWTNQDYGLIR